VTVFEFAAAAADAAMASAHPSIHFIGGLPRKLHSMPAFDSAPSCQSPIHRHRVASRRRVRGRSVTAAGRPCPEIGGNVAVAEDAA